MEQFEAFHRDVYTDTLISTIVDNAYKAEEYLVYTDTLISTIVDRETFLFSYGFVYTDTLISTIVDSVGLCVLDTSIQTH